MLWIKHLLALGHNQVQPRRRLKVKDIPKVELNSSTKTCNSLPLSGCRLPCSSWQLNKSQKQKDINKRVF